MPEPCGHAVLLLIIIIQKTVPCGRMKNSIALDHWWVMFVVGSREASFIIIKVFC